MKFLGFCCAAIAAIAITAPAAQAQIEITDWRAQVYTDASETTVFTQAGGHPYIGVTDFSLGNTSQADNVATIRVDVPPGLVPNPTIYPRCTMAQLQLGNSCPTNSQIGTEQLTISTPAIPVPVTVKVPLYNIEIEEDQVSRFGFNPADAAIVPGLGPALAALGLHEVEIIGGVRDALADANPPGSHENPFPADNGLFFRIDVSPTTPALLRSKLTFWGVPGDPSHASELGQSCITAFPITPAGGVCRTDPTPTAPPDPDLPFLANPTACTGQKLTTRLVVTSEGGSADSAIDQTPTVDGREGASGCELVPFAADFALIPDTSQPDAPTGPTATITVPQQGLHDADTLATSHVKDIAVTLPPGMTINPSVANGLEACTDAQLAVQEGVPGGEVCPEASRIGTVHVGTPLLPPLPGQPADGPDQVGSAYVGQPLPGDMYRLFVTIEGRGVSIRLKGSVRPDPNTGQITATFPNNPQLPADEITVDLRGGPLAPLANPLDCGPKTATATLTPWSGTAPLSVTSDPFPVAGESCPAAFRIDFSASTASPGSGQFAPLNVRIARGDRNQYLARIVRVDAPPGLGAKIRGVEQCAAAAAATGACPAASRIGTATTTAGAGSRPYPLSGPVYLTEGYKGSPFGMVVVVRAIAGPYDLGTVVVRQSLWVDNDDASVTVVSDSLPQILEGVPIRLRSIDVAIDRPGFVYNPTSCGTKEVGGRFHSVQGTVADPDARLTFSGCEQLGFTPMMRMRLTGARQMRQGGHPSLRVRVRQRPTQANVASAVVRLPKSLALDPENAQAVCDFEDALEADCPRATRIGMARVFSPVLNDTLGGPVYFVQGIRVDPETGARIRTLPTLLVKLNGEIRIDLRATTDVRRGHLVSVFPSVPDAPVSRFDMRLKGGKGGVLAATGRPRICGRRQVAISRVIGHNGKRTPQRKVRIGTAAPCKKLRRLQQKAKQGRAS